MAETLSAVQDPDYGFRKGEAARGKKMMSRFVLTFKPTNTVIGFKLRGKFCLAHVDGSSNVQVQ